MDFRAALLVFLLFIGASSASLSRDLPPKAKGVTWSSYNFKTILTWSPKPLNYTFTVEFSRVGKDRQRNPHCIRTQDTECDLTNDLLDLKSSYTADVLSEPFSFDLVELPSTQSKKFCPYNDTLIGKPRFTLKLNENNTVVIFVQDPLTALHQHGKPLTIRDVFKGDLKYKITYTKAGSTGPRSVVVDGNEVEMTELDKGQSYCFSVAAYLPSRRGAKKLGKWSFPQCSPAGGRSFLEEYGLWVVGSGLLMMVTFLVIVVILTVACCRRTKKGKQAEDSEAIAHV
ncbi:coagulation factor IIIb isoform X2 [Salminus brasiliensis]|uniref:coagulation factor IIIb isoform X2 n=1 Tax=Salminus brasiliensis TaxID=930266 RepID=UPI003B82D268